MQLPNILFTRNLIISIDTSVSISSHPLKPTGMKVMSHRCMTGLQDTHCCMFTATCQFQAMDIPSHIWYVPEPSGALSIEFSPTDWYLDCHRMSLARLHGLGPYLKHIPSNPCHTLKHWSSVHMPGNSCHSVKHLSCLLSNVILTALQNSHTSHGLDCTALVLLKMGTMEVVRPMGLGLGAPLCSS